MKHTKKLLPFLMALVLAGCTGVEISNSSESEQSEPTSSVSSSSTSETPSSSESSSETPSSSESSSSESESTSSEEDPTLSWDDCYMVGYGSFVNGTEWSKDGGKKASKLNDNPDALEKYVLTTDLSVGDVFLFTLDPKPDVWVGYSSISGYNNNTENKEYTEFFKVHSSNDIEVVAEGNYTFYVTIWKNYSAAIWVDVNSFNEPEVPVDVITCTTSGLANELVFEQKSPDADKLYKFEKYSTFSVGDEFNVVLTVNDDNFVYGFDTIEGFEDKSSKETKYTGSFLEAGTDGKIKVLVAGGYTLYVNVLNDKTAKLWINVWDYTAPKQEQTELDRGFYLTSSAGKDIFLEENATNDKPNEYQLHKYEHYNTFAVDEEITLKVADQYNVYNYTFDDVVQAVTGGECPSYDGDLVSEGTDGAIKINVAGGYTFYTFVQSDGSLDIYITAWSLTLPVIEPEVVELKTSGLSTEITLTRQDSDDASAIYKFQEYASFEEGNEFNFVLTEDEEKTTIGYSAIRNVADKSDNSPSYDGDFLEEGTDGKIKVNIQAGLTFYVYIYKDRSAGIWVDAWNYTLPSPTPVEVACVTDGLSEELTFEQKVADADKLYKFEQYSWIEAGSEFFVVLSEDDTAFEYGLSSIEGFEDKSDKTTKYSGAFYTEGSDGSIKILVSGGYTLYVNVLNDKTAKIWINVWNYNEPQEQLDPGFYLESSAGKNVYLDSTNDHPENEWQMHRYEYYDTFAAGEEVSIKVADDELTRTYHFDDVVQAVTGGECPSYDGDLVSEGTDGAIKINVAGGYTFYTFVQSDGSLDIYITAWSLVIA